MNRIGSVDLFRLIAISAVIGLHTQPFRLDLKAEPLSFWQIDVLLSQLARFAVPFFFVVSGFFWGRKLTSTGQHAPLAWGMIKRCLIIFFAWSLIYLLPFDPAIYAEQGVLAPLKGAYWNLMGFRKVPEKLIFSGTKAHLWFLIGLVCSVAIASFMVARRWRSALLALALVLYGIGLLAKLYAPTGLGIDTTFNTRNGPFFGLIFFVTGYFLAGCTVREDWLAKGLLLFGCGMLMQIAEVWLMWKHYGSSPYQDYAIGTYFAGTGVAMAALSNHRALNLPWLQAVGQLTLGIYAIHFVFVDLLRPLSARFQSATWEIGYVLAVLALSLASVLLLSSIKPLRRLLQ